MAEAIAGLATAASALQFADIGLRWSKEIHNFLSTVKHAPQEVEHLRGVIEDVNSVVRNLGRYVAEFGASASACADHDVLPEAITRAVQGFHDELGLIKELLPSQSSLRPGQNFRWGLDKKRKVKEAAEKLERRKTTVLLALEIDGRWADIKKRDDIRNLQEALTTASQAASNNHASSLEAVNSELVTMRDAGQRMEGLQAQSQTLLQGISDGLPTSHGIINEKLDNLTRIVTGLKISSEQTLSTTSTYSLGSQDILGKVFRAELRKILLPALEQGLAKSLSGKDAILRDIERKIDDISREMSKAAIFETFSTSQERQAQSPSDCQACLGSVGASVSNNNSHRGSTSSHNAPHDSDRERLQTLHRTLGSRTPAKLLDRIWSINCRIGYLKVQFQRFRRRDEYSGHDPFFSISIMFYPSCRLMRLPGISTYFTTQPNQQGHYQLCPLVSIFPIVSDAAPVWDCISRDDLDGLKSLLAKGRASPRDQNSRGTSLVARAASYGQRDMCKFLLEEGADPASSDVLGFTAFHDAFYGASCLFRVEDTVTISRDHDHDHDHDHDDHLDFRLFRLALNKHSEVSVILWNVLSDALEEDDQLLLYVLFWTTLTDVHLRTLWLNIFTDCTFELRQFISAVILRSPWHRELYVPAEAPSSSLAILLKCGYDPNTKLHGYLPLEQALFSLAAAKAVCGDGVQLVRGVAEQVFQRASDISGFHGWLFPLHTTVMLLLDGGASPYEGCMIPAGWLTLSALAAMLGVRVEWVTALRECGYDPKEVEEESFRRIEELRKSQGADRSAVDMTELLPRRETLTRRSGRVFEEV